MADVLCATCGTEYPASDGTPDVCVICQDERQYIGLSGQQWTTFESLQAAHANLFESPETGLTAIRTEPDFAIGQRAFLVQSPGGNVLWDCVSLLDDGTLRQIRELGGLTALAISHPHYYATMGRWSREFDGAPIYLHGDDRTSVVFPNRSIRFWEGETLALHDGLTLIRTGGHFAGSTVLHWPAGAGGRGVLLSGDTVQVVPDRRWVSFMYSYPNLIPLNAPAVRRITESLEPFEFDRVYGAFHPMQVVSDGKNAVRRSAERYLRAIHPDGLL